MSTGGLTQPEWLPCTFRPLISVLGKSRFSAKFEWLIISIGSYKSLFGNMEFENFCFASPIPEISTLPPHIRAPV